MKLFRKLWAMRPRYFSKKRDSMPPPDATPEEIGAFWDTHSLADYWDETEEVKLQIDLKLEQSDLPSEE